MSLRLELMPLRAATTSATTIIIVPNEETRVYPKLASVEDGDMLVNRQVYIRHPQSGPPLTAPAVHYDETPLRRTEPVQLLSEEESTLQ